MFPEQRKRTLGTSRPVDNVTWKKRPQFRQERRLRVRAYRFMNRSAFFKRRAKAIATIFPRAPRKSAATR